MQEKHRYGFCEHLVWVVSGSWSKLLVMLITIIYFQEIPFSTVHQLFYISAIFINNFRNTWLQTNHFWDNINQNSVQDLQRKKESKKWRLHCPIKTFPYITVDWPSEQQIPLTIEPRWNNKGELGRRWCVIASSA